MVQDGGAEQQQAAVVVPQGELVEGPGPVGTGSGVLAQHQQRVAPAVRGEVAQDGKGEAGAALVVGDQVLGGVEVVLDAFEGGFQVHVDAGVVEGAALDLPVGSRVPGDTLLQRGDGLGTVGGQRVELPVTTASLKEA